MRASNRIQGRRPPLARLRKFKGPDGLPNVRRPAVVADTAVGQATEAFGRQIQRSARQAGELGDLLLKRQAEFDALEREVVKARVDARVREKEAEERENLQPGAVGYADTMSSHYAQVRQDATLAQPERLQLQLARDFDAQDDHYATRFATSEYLEGQRFLRRRLDELLQVQTASVTENPNGLEGAIAKFTTLVDAVTLPTAAKESIRQAGQNSLVETWIRTLEPHSRLVHLERGGGKGDGAEPSADETVNDISQVRRNLVRDLPPPTRNRLREEAQVEIVFAEHREGEELVRRIISEAGGFDPDEVDQNQVLGPESKRRLRRIWEKQAAKTGMNQIAVRWSREAATGNPYSSKDRELSDLAFRYLRARGGEAKQAAKALLRDKRVLPDTYAEGLMKDMRGTDATVLQAAYEDLSGVSQIDPGAIPTGSAGARLQDSLLKWDLLTNRIGFSPAEAAEKLAKVNDPNLRRTLNDRLSGATEDLLANQHGTRFLLERISAQKPLFDGF